MCSVYLYYKDLTSKQGKCYLRNAQSQILLYKYIGVCVDLFHISLLLQLQKDQQAEKKTSTNK